ncbi:MAG: quinone oxidoreductase [Acidimicrobiia bacterium]|nr:quinone oxidoreductase [Acidimicrobiia bacterium]
MRAQRITEHGGPERLEWAEVDDPRPGPGDLLIDVAAAGVNFIDTYHREGRYSVPLPFIPGVEGAGTVVEVGTDVDRFAPGDRVAWCLTPGGYAERAVIPWERAVHIPGGVSDDGAAALFLQGLTAHYLAFDTFPLSAGDTCLVHAGAGGVGLLLIQLATAAGARVHATTSTPEKAALATGAGAVAVHDYASFVDSIREVEGTERPLDVIYDGVGATTFEPGLSLIRPRGLMALFGAASGPVPPFDLQALNTHGSLYVTRPSLGAYVSTPHELQGRATDLFTRVANGTLDVRIGARFALADAADAHRALEGRATTGKVLLLP